MSQRRLHSATRLLGLALAVVFAEEASKSQHQVLRAREVSLEDLFCSGPFFVPRPVWKGMQENAPKKLVRSLGPQQLHVNMRADARRSPQVRRCNQRIR